MSNFLIAKAANTYAAKIGGGVVDANTVNLLEKGAVAIFTEKNVLVTTATTLASIAQVKQFYMVVGCEDGIRNSPLIDRDAFFRDYCPYVAPVKMVRTLGQSTAAPAGGSLNLPGTLIAGTVASFDVSTSPLGQEPRVTARHYSQMVRPADTTATLLARLITDVNADPNPIVTAVIDASNAGIVLTAVEFGTPFDVTRTELFQYATVEENTRGTYGKGTPAQIKEQERRSWIYEGKTNFLEMPEEWAPFKTDVDTAAVYDQYSISWMAENRSATQNMGTVNNTVILAIPDGAQRATIHTIITTKILVTPPNSGAGNSPSPL